MKTLTNVLDVAAAALVAAGLALVYVPAGLIGAGLLLGAMSWRLERAT